MTYVGKNKHMGITLSTRTRARQWRINLRIKQRLQSTALFPLKKKGKKIANQIFLRLLCKSISQSINRSIDVIIMRDMDGPKKGSHQTRKEACIVQKKKWEEEREKNGKTQDQWWKVGPVGDSLHYSLSSPSTDSSSPTEDAPERLKEPDSPSPWLGVLWERLLPPLLLL